MEEELTKRGIHLIPVYSPFPLGIINVYLFTHEPLTLVDCGPNLPQSLSSLEKGLAKTGFSLEDIQRVIITHEHPDHYGLIRTLVERSGAKVCCHYRIKAMIEDFSSQREKRRMAYLSFLEEAGVPEPVIEYVRKDTEKPAGLRSETPVDLSLQDGDIIPCDQASLQVLHTPGHSMGSICLYCEQEQILFTGDHLLKSITSNPMIEIPVGDSQGDYTSLIDYLASLEKIRQLEITLALPAHGDLISNHRQVITSLLEHHQQRRDQINQLLSQEKLTSYEISRRLFGDLHPLEVFLGISEVLAHLELLQREQKLYSSKKGNIIYYGLLSSMLISLTSRAFCN